MSIFLKKSLVVTLCAVLLGDRLPAFERRADGRMRDEALALAAASFKQPSEGSKYGVFLSRLLGIGGLPPVAVIAGAVLLPKGVDLVQEIPKLNPSFAILHSLGAHRPFEDIIMDGLIFGLVLAAIFPYRPIIFKMIGFLVKLAFAPLRVLGRVIRRMWQSRPPVDRPPETKPIEKSSSVAPVSSDLVGNKLLKVLEDSRQGFRRIVRNGKEHKIAWGTELEDVVDFESALTELDEKNIGEKLIDFARWQLLHETLETMRRLVWRLHELPEKQKKRPILLSTINQLERRLSHLHGEYEAQRLKEEQIARSQRTFLSSFAKSLRGAGRFFQARIRRADFPPQAA